MLKILTFLKGIPTAFWAGLAVILVVFGAYFLGSHNKQKEWDADTKAKAQHVVVVKEAQNNVSDKIKTEYVNTIRQALVEGETKIKQVPIYVPVQADSQCIVNNGFVSMWNSSNRGESLPDSPDRTSGEASGVKLSDIETQHITESTYTRNLEIQVNKWIDWYEQQKEVTK